jgi:hypothetical protein
MYDGENTEAGGVRTPPYVSFQTFMTLVDDFKTNGLPPRVDRSVLKRFSGGVGGQLQSALKSLGLTDEGNVPSDRLSRMVKVYQTEGFKDVLKECLEFAYPFLAKLDLTTATPSMFAEAFRNGTSAREDVLKKCRRFYIYAAQFCGIEVGNRLTAGAASPSSRAPGSGGGYKRRTSKRASGGGAGGLDSEQTPPGRLHAPVDGDPVQVLVSILDMSAMDEEEQQAVWTLIRHLKKKQAKAGGAS